MRLDNSRTSGENIADRPPRKRKRTKNGGTPATDQARRRKARATRKTAVAGSGVHAAQQPVVVEEGGLTPDQIRRLERRLLDERQRALRTLWARRMDMEDHRAAGSLDEVELDIRMAERHSEFLGLIDEALRRLHESPEDFDVSVVSGARIPFERLEMVPWTRRLTEEVGHGYD